MNIKACDRVACYNINCNHHAPIFGYICDECKDELIHLLDGDESANLYLFMTTHKNPNLTQGNGEDIFYTSFNDVTEE